MNDNIDNNLQFTNLYNYVMNAPVNYLDPYGTKEIDLGQGWKAVKDKAKHGGSHIDFYKNGKNVGRFRLDGTPIIFKGKLPKVSKSKLLKAMKCLKMFGIILFIIDFLLSPTELDDGELTPEQEMGNNFKNSNYCV